MVGFGMFQESVQKLANSDIFIGKAKLISGDFYLSILQGKLSDLLGDPYPLTNSATAGVNIYVLDAASFVDSSHIRRLQLVTI